MLRDKLVSAYMWIFIIVMVLFWTPMMAIIFVCTAPFDPGRYVAGRWFRLAGALAIKVNPRWHFRWSGYHVPDPRHPYVFVANHESYADIFLLCLLPWEMKWMSKAQVLSFPLMGWMMRMAGDIPVQRDSRESRAAAMEGVTDRLSKKVSVMIMPEGTRSRTQDMLPFRDGAFRMAIEQRVPIVPIVIAGTRNAMAAGSFIFNHATAEARVLEPVPTDGLTLADVQDLKERIRETIRVARDQLRAEVSASATSS